MAIANRVQINPIGNRWDTYLVHKFKYIKARDVSAGRREQMTWQWTRSVLSVVHAVADQQKQPTPRPINNKKWIANWTDPYTLYILELHTFNSIHTLFCGKQFTWAWMTRRSIEENVTCFSLCTYRHTLVGCMQGGGGGGGIHCYRFRSICGRYIHYLVYHYSL